MKFLRKSSILLAVCAMMLLSTAVFAENDDIEVFEMPMYSLMSLSDYSLMDAEPLTDTEKEMFEYIADQFGLYASEIPIEGVYDITAVRFVSTFPTYMARLIQFERPDLFYVGLNPTYSARDGKVVSLNPAYKLSAEEAAEREIIINEEVEHIVSLTNDDMTDLQKVLIVHDYIVSNYAYDTTYSINTLDETIINKRCVCQGYSYLFKTVMDALGIDNAVVPSTQNEHMWSKVKIDGEWYNVDLTYDDPMIDRSTNILHDYFLLNDDEIKQVSSVIKDDGSVIGGLHSTWDDVKWDGSPIEVSDSTVFSDSVLHAIKGATTYCRGSFYCLNHANDICRIIFDENVLREDYTLARNFLWFVRGDKRFAYIGHYTALVSFDGDLYFNSPDKVYRYTPGNGDEQGKADEVYTFSGTADPSETYLFGMTVRDDILYAEYSEDIIHGPIALLKIAEPKPRFDDLPCTVETLPTTVVSDEGEVQKAVTVNVEIPPQVTEVLGEKPRVMVAQYDADGLFIGMKEVFVDDSTGAAGGTFTVADGCETVKTFVWSSIFMPLSSAAAVDMDSSQSN